MNQNSLGTNFSEIINHYHIMVLNLSDYRPSTRQLSEDFSILPIEQIKNFREQEKQLLKSTFDNWAVAYCRQLKGYRNDSAILATMATELVGGAYLCGKTVYDKDSQSGEIHYTYVHPDYMGMGIYSVIFREAVARADNWGLSRLYITTDRNFLPDVYQRWGAKEWKKTAKWPLLNLGPIRMFQKIVRKYRYYWFKMLGKCN